MSRVNVFFAPEDRVFVMPATVGSTVYSYDPADTPVIVAAQVIGYELKQDEWWVIVREDTYYKMTMQARVSDLGKSWFLSNEEAEAAAKAIVGADELEKAFRDGIKEGKSQFAAELKEYIYRNYGDARGAVRATASHITDMIDALNYGYCGWGAPPKESDFLNKRGGPDG